MYNKLFNFDDIDKQIIDLIQQGNTAKEIGKAIFRSSRTVETRIRKLREFYKAKNLKHLISIISEISKVPKPLEAETQAVTRAKFLLKNYGSVSCAECIASQMIKQDHDSINFWTAVKLHIEENQTNKDEHGVE